MKNISDVAVFAWSTKVLKRTFDLVVSCVLLIVTLPIMAAIALVILIDDGAPVIFRQTRIGKAGSPFTIYKFRTMRKGTPNRATSSFNNSADFITASGRFLRKTSLDELPQLINIILGQMSIVGPRPLIPEEGIIHQLRHQSGVYRMRPGITGLAQINGRDLVNDQQKAELDAQYVNQFTPWLDAYILIRTVLTVIRAEGIQEGQTPEKLPAL